MKDIEQAKNLIRKLLALSKSDNENEAATALEKANELMQTYGVNEDDTRVESVRVNAVSRHVPWRSIIANAVSDLYCCYWYMDDGDFVFNGEELDVFMASEMYKYLARTIERIAKKNVRKNARYYFRQDFKRGMADRLYDRIMELGEQCSWRPQTERKARIECAKEVTKKHIETEPVKTKERKINHAAFTRGAVLADDVSLARQTGYTARGLVTSEHKPAQGELF